jgi:hypothetical protein
VRREARGRVHRGPRGRAAGPPIGVRRARRPLSRGDERCAKRVPSTLEKSCAAPTLTIPHLGCLAPKEPAFSTIDQNTHTPSDTRAIIPRGKPYHSMHHLMGNRGALSRVQSGNRIEGRSDQRSGPWPSERR